MDTIDLPNEIDLIQEIEARRRRSKFLPSQLFSEPGWDMLLYLALRHLQQRRVTTTELVAASGAPYSTGLRHLQSLSDAGMIQIKGDPLDKRRKYIALCSDTLNRISLAIGCANA
ncbi:MarR family winged helix-turn-helix transcriptional regulator [Sphingomicrobium nitratireducens]|uniref:MarR family winged helix-turn-helix transcriptional regulator n=1 Tax=Sphingomicrobium nitratireducens TaxID=2964666 RepID=UPI00223F92A8|nr:MarR family winged helix-turn-helix transcriptional regulator [Sphingomicrobium nitratireducens]